MIVNYISHVTTTCPFISPPSHFFSLLFLSLSPRILTTQPFSHNSNYLHRALISGNLLFPSRDKKIFRKKSTVCFALPLRITHEDYSFLPFPLSFFFLSSFCLSLSFFPPDTSSILTPFSTGNRFRQTA